MNAEEKLKLQRWCVFVASLIASLMVGEIAFRLLRPTTSAYSVGTTGDQYCFYQYDPELGWVNTPGARGTFQRDEFRYEVEINRHGMRQGDVTFEPPHGCRRIAVMGDSFVWGIGVADEQRFTELLARRLKATEVLNFGVSGYCPVQYLLDLDHVLRFSPNIVILTFCLGNDFVDNVESVRYGYNKPYADLDGSGKLRILGREVPESKAFGFQRRQRWLGSELLGSFRRLLLPHRLPTTGKTADSLSETDMYHVGIQSLESQRSHAIEVNDALLAEIKRRLDMAGVPLLVISAPTKLEYENHGEGNTGEYNDVLEQELAQSCQRHSIDFVPMVARLNMSDFWRRDGHWNPEGHRKLAETLADRLVSLGFERVQVETTSPDPLCR